MKVVQPHLASLTAFHQHCDVNRLLVQLRTLVLVLVENQVVECIGRKFWDKFFLNNIKVLAAKSALRFNGYQDH